MKSKTGVLKMIRSCNILKEAKLREEGLDLILEVAWRLLHAETYLTRFELSAS